MQSLIKLRKQTDFLEEIVNIPPNPKSAGVETLPPYTDNLDGTITIATGEIWAYADNDFNLPLTKYTVEGDTYILTDNSQNFVVFKTDPIPGLYILTSRDSINQSNVIPIYSIYREGTVLHILNWDYLAKGLPNKLSDMLVRTMRFKRENGLALSESATRVVNVSGGTVWVGGVQTDLDDVISSTDLCDLYYHVAGVWTKSTITAYNNTQYDNGTDLVTLGNGRYAINYIYRLVEEDKHIAVILGSGDYKENQALGSGIVVPPDILSCQAILVGRIIVEKDASTAKYIQSAFDLTYTYIPVTSHPDLTDRDSPDAHPASAITFDKTDTDLDATTDQEAIVELDDKIDSKSITRGFYNDDIISTYDATARTVTLSGDLQATYNNSLVSETIPAFVSGYVSVAHPEEDETYILSFNGTDIDWRTEFNISEVLIAIKPKYCPFVLRETHTKNISVRAHLMGHLGLGTILQSGGLPTGFVLDSTTASERRPDVSAAKLLDEDLPTTIAELTSKAYTRCYLSGADVLNWDVDTDDIVEVGEDNRPYYYELNSGTYTKTLMPKITDGTPSERARYMSIYKIAIPTCLGDGVKYRFIWMQGQGFSTSAQAELDRDPRNLELGTLQSIPEYSIAHQFVIKYDEDNWSITEDAEIRGGKFYPFVVGGNIATLWENHLGFAIKPKEGKQVSLVAGDATSDGDNLQNNGLWIDGDVDTDKQLVFAENGVPKWTIQGAWRNEDGKFIYFYNLDSEENILVMSRGGRWSINKPTNIIMNHAAFVGTGVNDMIPSGLYDQGIVRGFNVEIDSEGTPDTFKWSVTTDGISFVEQANSVPIVTGEITLNWGISIEFGATTGHVTGDKWSFRAHPQDALDTVTLKPPMHHHVFLYDGANFEDQTYQASTVHCSIGGSISCLQTTDDILYLGNSHKFGSAYFLFNEYGADLTLIAEYWNGTVWTTLTLNDHGYSDRTSNFTANGSIVWSGGLLASWVKTTINGEEEYWIRLRSSTNSTITPTIRAISRHTDYRLAVYSAHNDTRRNFAIKGDGVAEIFEANRTSTATTYRTNEFITERRLRSALEFTIGKASYLTNDNTLEEELPEIAFSKSVAVKKNDPFLIGKFVESEAHGKDTVTGDTFEAYLFLQRSAANRALNFYVEVWQVQSDGTDITLLGTSNVIPAPASTDIETYDFKITSAGATFAATDRIAIKVYAQRTTSHNQTATLWGGGGYTSQLNYPAETLTLDDLLDHFEEAQDGIKNQWKAKGTGANYDIELVPKGAGKVRSSADVDLGNNDLRVGGDVVFEGGFEAPFDPSDTDLTSEDVILAIKEVNEKVNAEFNHAVTDGNYSGETTTENVGESVNFGDLLYFNWTDKEYKKASNDDAATMPAVAIALESKSDGQSCKLLRRGFIHKDAWTFDAAIVMAGGSAVPTTTLPATTGYQVQRLGTAISSKIMYFNPDLTVVEVPEA